MATRSRSARRYTCRIGKKSPRCESSSRTWHACAAQRKPNSLPGRRSARLFFKIYRCHLDNDSNIYCLLEFETKKERINPCRINTKRAHQHPPSRPAIHHSGLALTDQSVTMIKHCSTLVVVVGFYHTHPKMHKLGQPLCVALVRNAPQGADIRCCSSSSSSCFCFCFCFCSCSCSCSCRNLPQGADICGAARARAGARAGQDA